MRFRACRRRVRSSRALDGREFPKSLHKSRSDSTGSYRATYIISLLVDDRDFFFFFLEEIPQPRLRPGPHARRTEGFNLRRVLKRGSGCHEMAPSLVALISQLLNYGKIIRNCTLNQERLNATWRYLREANTSESHELF